MVHYDVPCLKYSIIKRARDENSFISDIMPYICCRRYANTHRTKNKNSSGDEIANVNF